MSDTTTHADAWRTWADLVTLERSDWTWRTFLNGRGDIVHLLDHDGPPTVTAGPYLDAVGRERFQVYVTDCGHAGHAFPVDTLEEAAQQGLTTCKRLTP